VTPIWVATLAGWWIAGSDYRLLEIAFITGITHEWSKRNATGAAASTC